MRDMTEGQCDELMVFQLRRLRDAAWKQNREEELFALFMVEVLRPHVSQAMAARVEELVPRP